MITAVVLVNDIENDDYVIQKDFDPALKDRIIPVVLEYLAEGGANVVLRLVPFARASKLVTPPDALVNKVLRVRKDKGFVTSAKQQQAHFDKTFSPLFSSEHLVTPSLVAVDAGFLRAVNMELAEVQAAGLRPPGRVGDTVNEREQHATFMADMSPLGSEISFEIKPKWLLQSPDAPRTAVRCRTCALRAQRLRTGRFQVKDIDKGYCPLALLSKDRESNLQAATAILKANEAHEWMTHGQEALADLLPTYIVPVLEQIRDYQARFDPTGISALRDREEPPSDYLVAMTLRDCAMFLRTHKSLRHGPLEVRLADLDAKMPHPDKIKKWRETELTLVNEGWYECKETDAAKEEICVLSK